MQKSVDRERGSNFAHSLFKRTRRRATIESTTLEPGHLRRISKSSEITLLLPSLRDTYFKVSGESRQEFEECIDRLINWLILKDRDFRMFDCCADIY